ncbi:hypothetical protein REPUB_Repub12eG0066400 [Reevesia pubescens]
MVLSSKGINVEAMKTVFVKVWKLLGRLHIKEVSDRIYVFCFLNTLEKENIMDSQPWSFNRLPIAMMNEKVVLAVDEVLGDVEEIDLRGDMVA